MKEDHHLTVIGTTLAFSFSYIHYFIIILSWVNNEPTQWPAPSSMALLYIAQLVEHCTSLMQRSRVSNLYTGAWIFELFFCNYKSCTYNRDDRFSFTKFFNPQYLILILLIVILINIFQVSSSLLHSRFCLVT